MKPNNYFKVFLTFATLTAILLMSCGGTRDDSLFLDDETFPTEETASDILLDDQLQATDSQADEAEVLRLLGITPAEQSASTTEPAQSDVSSNNASSIQEEVTKLENQLAVKDREIESMRVELNAKSGRISDLEKEMRQSKRSGTYAQPMARGSSEFEMSYQHALSLYNNRDYRAAIQEFERLLSTSSTNSLSDNCQYWIGECYYGLANFNEAIIEFNKVFNHTNSNKYDDAQLKLGLCYLRLGDRAKARAEFERLLTNYPDSEYANKADQYITGL